MTEMTLERKEGRSWLRRFGDRWGARDLVVIGVFAATAKLSTVLIAMVGGGMNPVSLLLKNVVFTTLLVIMLYKVRQPGNAEPLCDRKRAGELSALGRKCHTHSAHAGSRFSLRSSHEVC